MKYKFSQQNIAPLPFQLIPVDSLLLQDSSEVDLLLIGALNVGINGLREDNLVA